MNDKNVWCGVWEEGASWLLLQSVIVTKKERRAHSVQRNWIRTNMNTHTHTHKKALSLFSQKRFLLLPQEHLSVLKVLDFAPPLVSVNVDSHLQVKAKKFKGRENSKGKKETEGRGSDTGGLLGVWVFGCMDVWLFGCVAGWLRRKNSTHPVGMFLGLCNDGNDTLHLRTNAA